MRQYNKEIDEHIRKYGKGSASAQKFAINFFKESLGIPEGRISSETIRDLIEQCVYAGYKFAKYEDKVE